ncbi:MAG: NADPH-dependent 7-cyano-7-deazaguanine reductase QueF, partial [Candidatus Margulisiibacteriota bacterium]
LVESKSLKLYLNSFNQTPFASAEMVRNTIIRDLSTLLGIPVSGHWISTVSFAQTELAHCIDQDLSVSQYQPDASLLTLSDAMAQETLTTTLFRSLCPVTGQPDWASIWIRYKGPKIRHEGLLRYLISYREHRAFHETTIEKIFCDLSSHCHPIQLSVYGRFTRRGGIDINPFRSNFESDAPAFSDFRQ